MSTETQLREDLAELEQRLCDTTRLLGFSTGKEFCGCSRNCEHKALLKRLLAESVLELERARGSSRPGQLERLRLKFIALLSQLDGRGGGTKGS